MLVPMDTVAAVDLGSNSFHMIIARRDDQELRIMDRIREPVKLGAGLDAKKRLDEEAQQRALDCLRRFGQRIQEMDAGQVRAVGTNTLRKAKNARKFLKKAKEALGHRVEVVSGLEEARLIYLGVAHSASDDAGRRLVVDIGGGSTEVILGERFTVVEADSLHMGCVSFSRRHFPDGKIRRKHLRKAQIAARLELQTLERRFRGLGWDTAVGASGTVRAISEVLQANGWGDEHITPAGLDQLEDALVEQKSIDELSLKALKPERASVLPGGLAILRAVFDSLRLETMTSIGGALREGLMYDLLGRIRHEDVRDRTIRRFVERYQVDMMQASRVERSALYLLDRVAAAWDLLDLEARQLLSWAARLHEIGLVVSYTNYHKHGAYLVRNSHMAGFSEDDQQVLAAMIRFHRRKVTGSVDEVPALKNPRVLRLGVLLRIAVVLNRSRSKKALPYFSVEAGPGRLVLTFPEDWPQAHPLTRADLEVEAELLAARGFNLEVQTHTP